MIWDKLIKIDAITSKYFWLLAIIAIIIGLIIVLCSCSHTYKQPHYVPHYDFELMTELTEIDTITYKVKE
jgi:hypothetical protein